MCDGLPLKSKSVRLLKEGDVVEAEIEGIGILRNEIAIDK